MLTPTTMSPTSLAFCRNSPVSTDSMPGSPAAGLGLTTEPEGMAWLAEAIAPCSACTLTPRSRSLAGSSHTCTARPGPPMVTTSRVPGTRLSSVSTACATRSRSSALCASFVHSVAASTGTSSMPLGLTIGVSTPRPCGSQSWLALSTSYRRTSASVRGTPTLNCTVSTATPGRATE
ncbi:hypothetical protein D9M68_708870 [compost metagenome]